MRAEELLTQCDHALIAFDGPIAELPAIDAGRLRTMVADSRPPRKVRHADDPFVVVAFAATIGPGTEQAVYAQLRRLELEAVASASVAPGAREALATMAAAGTQVTVVSGLALRAVRTFLVIHGLLAHVKHLACRTGPDPAVLPPAPDLITSVIHEHAMESCVFVGSTDDDLTAARAAGVRAFRHRYRPAAEPAESQEPAEPPTWFDALRDR